jgi:hypothetical protein
MSLCLLAEQPFADQAENVSRLVGFAGRPMGLAFDKSEKG